MTRRRVPPRERVALIRTAVDRGLTAIDTAPLYDFGEVESLLGEALSVFPRERFQLLGKVGLCWRDGARGEVLFEFEDRLGAHRQVRRDSRPESVRRDVEESLARLRVDHLDLLQIHHPDTHTPFSETMQVLLDLRREGKIREIGVSNFSAPQIRAVQGALGDVPLASVQPELSLLRRDAERDVLPVCRELEIGVLAYSPLAWGLLAGAVPQHVPARVRSRVQSLLAQHLVPIARAHRVAPAAVALAWVLSRPGVTAAIAGASSLAQLEDQCQAIELCLAADEIELLTRVFAGFDQPLGAQPSGILRRVVRRVRRTAGGMLRAAGIDPGRLRGH
jgi:aryl-alcohol dehydrogenase-like predicted oxidoreductase